MGDRPSVLPVAIRLPDEEHLRPLFAFRSLAPYLVAVAIDDAEVGC